jgi:hypothetical protein
MNKAEALKKAIERSKEINDQDFEDKVASLVWDIERTSQHLRDLKKELTELTYKEVPVPDLSDCMEGGN